MHMQWLLICLDSMAMMAMITMMPILREMKRESEGEIEREKKYILN